ncbi:MAG: hypothetical protein ABL872_08510 [Lacibacter sp.]
MQIPFVLIFFALFFLAFILVYLGIILARHYRSNEQIKLLNSLQKNNTDLTFAKVKMKFSWSTGYKSYISFINYCDIYLADDYVVIMPFQTFPFKAFNEPILLTGSIVNLKSGLGFLKQYIPDKIIFKKVIKGEIEINYHEGNAKYVIRLQGLNTEEKQHLERIKEWHQ